MPPRCVSWPGTDVSESFGHWGGWSVAIGRRMILRNMSELPTALLLRAALGGKESGEMSAGPDGLPRCPDCCGAMLRRGLDEWQCQKCNAGWTITALGGKEDVSEKQPMKGTNK